MSVVLAVIIALDLITKAVFDGKVMPFINGLIGIVGTAHNYGAGFSILQNARVFFVVLAVIFIGAFIMYEIYTKDKNKHFLYYISAGLILGGAIGNAVDRVALGYVRDFINFEFMNFPIFNLADVALTFGVIIFAVYIVFIYDKEKKEQNKVENQDGKN